MSSSFKYPDTMVIVEFTCTKHGVKSRVEVEQIFGPYSPSPFQHCLEDDDHDVTGRIVGISEERDGKLIRIKP